jgi:hypothetical protein
MQYEYLIGGDGKDFRKLRDEKKITKEIGIT